MAVAGFTARRAYATGFVIGLFLIATTVANALTGELTGEWTKWVALLDILSLPTQLVGMIFDKVTDSNPALEQMNNLNDAIPIAWYLVLTVGTAALLLRRYQKAGQ